MAEPPVTCRQMGFLERRRGRRRSSLVSTESSCPGLSPRCLEVPKGGIFELGLININVYASGEALILGAKLGFFHVFSILETLGLSWNRCHLLAPARICCFPWLCSSPGVAAPEKQWLCPGKLCTGFPRGKCQTPGGAGP